MKLFWMMLAGALGVAARYGLTLWIQSWLEKRAMPSAALAVSGGVFPLGTLVINVLGSLLLAFVTTLVAHEYIKPEWRLILGTGFLGAFTTFSTFELEGEELLARGANGAAALYIGGNLVLGFGAILLGRWAALRLIGSSTFGSPGTS